MSSRLATALHAVPVAPSSIGDLIWRNSDLQSLEKTHIAPSEDLLHEYSMLISGPAATTVGRLTPDPSLCDYIHRNLSKDFVEGLKSNPHTPLSSIASIDKDKFNFLTDTAKKFANGENLDHDFLKAPNYAFIEILESQGLLDRFIASIKDTVYMSSYVGLLISVQNCEFLPRFVSALILDSSMVIDYYSAYFLATSKTLVADTLVTELKNVKSGRISESAQAILNAYGVGYGSDFAKRPAESKESDVSVSMLETLKLAGMSDSEISALAFSNASADIDSDFLVSIVIGSPDSSILQFLTGSYARSPKPHEVEKIMANLPHDRFTNLISQLTEKDLDVSWASYLIKYLPRRALDTLPTYSIFELYKSIVDKVEVNTNAWDFILVMSEEWENSFNELLEASILIDKEYADG